MRTTVISLLICAGFNPQSALADDWPQFMGPKRDSIWRETGIVKRFPKAGLKVKWRVPVALGYSGPAVADGRVFLVDYAKKSGRLTNRSFYRDKLEGSERVLCLHARTGKQLWKYEYERPYSLSYAGGPRCTPTVDGDRVYVLGAEGDLLCLKAETGHVVWRKLLTKEYATKTPLWGFSAHPLIDGDLLYCVVGGKGSVAVAFNKHSGKEVWKALSAGNPGHCPPTMIQHAGRKQLLIWHAHSLNSLNPKTGKVYWTIPLAPSNGMAITPPRLSGDYLYVSGVRVAAVIQLDDDKPAAKVVWRSSAPRTGAYAANSTPIIDGGIIYGNDSNQGSLMGVRLSDGKQLWSTFEPTTGGKRPARWATVFVVKNEDRYFLFSEIGDLIVARLSAKGYEELGRFHLLEPTNFVFRRKVVWTHPAFANRCAYARNDKELVCVSLAAEGK